MSSYYVNTNAQANGDHEVHTSGCSYLPAPENRNLSWRFYELSAGSCRGTQILLPSQWLLLLFTSVSYDVKVYELSRIKEKVQWHIKKSLARR